MTNPAGVDVAMIVRNAAPYNGEPPLSKLNEGFCTPQSLLYVRSHGNIPDLNPAAHRLKITGLVQRIMALSIEDLRSQFAHCVVVATMQCAGNRRADLNKIKQVSGDLWQPGAIGNVAWGGVSLADVLRAAGVDKRAGLHVAFSGGDDVEIEGERFRFGVSIPIEKALTPEVLLAFEINGEALEPAHGYPIRVIVPGYAGVRSAKWLMQIEVRETPSENHMQQKDYLLFPPHMTKETANLNSGMVINELPLNSAICTPEDGAELSAGLNMIGGYATASNQNIARVDVSIDGGNTWQQAQISPRPDERWSWTLWQVQIALPEGKIELAVRAWDSAGQTQPSRAEDVWNFKGYLSSAWHRITVHAA